MWHVGGSKTLNSVSNHKWASVETIKASANFGVDTYELSGMANKMDLKPEGVSYAQELIDTYKVNFSLHGTFHSSTMSNLAKEYDWYSMETSLNYARDWNCPVVLHPGGDVNKKDPVGQMNSTLDKLSRAITNTGIDSSLVYIETMGRVNSFGTLEHVINLALRLNVRICVDWSHIYARYMAIYNRFDEVMINDILDVMEFLPFPQEQYYHLSGMSYNYQGEKKHTPFEDSEFPYQMVLNLINERNLSGRIIVESGGGGDKTGDFLGGVKLIKKYIRDNNLFNQDKIG